MLPDWFSTVVMTGSIAAARIVCCVAENGCTRIDPDGRRVLAARLSYRDIGRDTGLSSSTIPKAIREAIDRGWLSVSYPESARAPNLYFIPVSISAPGNAAIPGLETGAPTTAKSEAGAASKIEVSRPETASKIALVGTAKIEAVREPPGPVALNRGPAMPVTVPEGAETSSKFEVVTTAKIEDPYGGDDGGGNLEITKSLNTVTPHQHHHDAELLRILESYGFGDAGEFLDKHHPDRVRAALEFVRSLTGINNPGAFLRHIVERPGKIPAPIAPKSAFPTGSLTERNRQIEKSWERYWASGKGDEQLARVRAKLAERNEEDEDDGGVSGGTTPTAT
jgi:hypothetical protein